MLIATSRSQAHSPDPDVGTTGVRQSVAVPKLAAPPRGQPVKFGAQQAQRPRQGSFGGGQDSLI